MIIGKNKTMTLKEFLTQNGIQLDNETRCKLGKSVAHIWNCKRLGEKKMTQEGEYKVIDYPIEYLESKVVIKKITKFLTK